MGFIQDKIPKDVLDEIDKAGQNEVLSYFDDADCSEEDIESFVRQVLLPGVL